MAARPGPAPPPQDFETFLEPIFAMFKAQRRGGEETLGDFVARVGFDAVREYQAGYIAPSAADKLPKVGGAAGGSAWAVVPRVLKGRPVAVSLMPVFGLLAVWGAGWLC